MIRFQPALLLAIPFAFSISALHPSRVAAQELRFVQAEEGLLDTQTGLVWGHHLTEVDRFLTGGSSTVRTWEFTMEMWVGDLVDVDGDGDLDLNYFTTTYPSFSNAFYGRTDDDWRLPYRDELVEAIQAGLMLYLDISPEPGVQLLEDYLPPNVPEGQGYNTLVWAGKNRIKGGNADAVDLLDATVTQKFTSSTLWGSIPVRGGSSDGGGGKGGGKGKNK